MIMRTYMSNGPCTKQIVDKITAIYLIHSHLMTHICARDLCHQRFRIPWWRHQMETFSALVAICAGNSPVTGEFPTRRPVTRSFDVFFDLCPNERLSKQSWGWWFGTLSSPLWRHRNANPNSLQCLIPGQDVHGANSWWAYLFDFCHRRFRTFDTSTGYYIFHTQVRWVLPTLATSDISRVGALNPDRASLASIPVWWHRSPVNSFHTGQWRGALMFSLICDWINAWVNIHEAGDLRRHRTHYDVIVMYCTVLLELLTWQWKINQGYWIVRWRSIFVHTHIYGFALRNPYCTYTYCSLRTALWLFGACCALHLSVLLWLYIALGIFIWIIYLYSSGLFHWHLDDDINTAMREKYIERHG